MNVYIFIIIFTIFAAIAIYIINFRHRKLLTSRTMCFLCTALIIYSVGYLFEILAKDLETKILFYNIEYFGIVMLPFLWFVFSLQYSDYGWLLSKARIIMLAIIPIITIMMVWTNKYHGFMVRIVGISSSGAVPEILKISGPWYWVNITYSYLLMMAGSIILLRSVFGLPYIYIRKGIILVLGALMPIIGNLLYIFHLTPVMSFDFTPFTTTIGGVFLTWSIYRLKGFQTIPIARDKVFDNMEDAIIVVDTEGRIVDANKSSQKLFGFQIEDMIEHDIISFFNDKNLTIDIESIENNLTEEFKKTPFDAEGDISAGSSWVLRSLLFLPGEEMGEKYRENKRNNNFDVYFSRAGDKNFTEDDNLSDDTERKIFSVSILPLEKSRMKISGYLLVFHDITNIRKKEQYLKEQSEIDTLTGIYNRRYFDNYIAKEVERSKRNKNKITFIIADIDRFKEVNDRYGHQAGDMILKGVGNILKSQIRKIDTVIRYGGDEFLIILPGLSDENTDSLINRIEDALLECSKGLAILDFNIELSIGVSIWHPMADKSVEECITSADKAMYADKKRKNSK